MTNADNNDSVANNDDSVAIAAITDNAAIADSAANDVSDNYWVTIQPLEQHQEQGAKARRNKWAIDRTKWMLSLQPIIEDLRARS